jgi:hypothetical protein
MRATRIEVDTEGPRDEQGYGETEETVRRKSSQMHKGIYLRVLFIGLVLLLDLTWSKIAPGVEGY